MNRKNQLPLWNSLLLSACVLLFIILLLSCKTSKEEADMKRVLVLEQEFIFEQASFLSCHASTVAETSDGLIATWFGGTRESNEDVEIWVSRKIKN